MSEKPYTVLTGEPKNIVFELPHQGRSIPDACRRYTRLVEAAEQRWDHYIGEAGRYVLDSAGGTLIHSHVSRLVVDLNRGADRIDSRVCSCWPGARVYEDGGAIVPNTVLRQQRIPLYDSPLNGEEVEDRLCRYWYPYHDRLRQLIDSTASLMGSVLLISLHSAEPLSRYKTPKQPVVFLGTRNGRTCEPMLVEIIKSALEIREMIVVTQDAYQGAFTTQAYGVEPHVNAIQIELDRRALKTGVTQGKGKQMLDALISGLRAVSISGVSSRSSKQTSRLGRLRSYIDPLTGDCFTDR